jgi:hypothetical protein
MKSYIQTCIHICTVLTQRKILGCTAVTKKSKQKKDENVSPGIQPKSEWKANEEIQRDKNLEKQFFV